MRRQSTPRRSATPSSFRDHAVVAPAAARHCCASSPPVPVSAASLRYGAGNSSGLPATAALLAGFAPDNLATPFGGTLLVQVVAGFTISVPASGARVPLAIPPATELCGVSVFFQTAQVDGGASHGIAFSPGLELILGV